MKDDAKDMTALIERMAILNYFMESIVEEPQQ